MPIMARTALTVQLGSFKGIYVAPFTTGPLVPEHPNLVDGNSFVNTRGKTLLVISNNSADTDIKLTLDATASVAENPSTLPVVDPEITVEFGTMNIIGPFTGNFEQSGLTTIWLDWDTATVLGDVDIAVVRLP
jgi:hypothetical protein